MDEKEDKRRKIKEELVDLEETNRNFKRLSSELNSESFPNSRKLLREISADYLTGKDSDELVANERLTNRSIRRWDDLENLIHKKMGQRLSDAEARLDKVKEG